MSLPPDAPGPDAPDAPGPDPYYPPALYHAPGGEVSAVYRPSSTPPDLVRDNGVTTEYLATGAATARQFGLYRWTFGPQATGPAPHVHRTISESFYVLTGTVQLYDGARWVDAGPGDFLHVPAGGVHAFRNVPGEPASMLLLFAPGADREPYFEGLVDGVAGWDDEAQARFYLTHDNHWV